MTDATRSLQLNAQGQLRHFLSLDDLPAELTDVDSIKYWLIKPEDLADAVVHVIDQPWGISLSDVTVRASGEDYLY